MKKSIRYLLSVILVVSMLSLIGWRRWESCEKESI